MKEDYYEQQVNLLIEVLPYALMDNRMALKGGTAINLFHQNFPRLSVDIDLCYLPLEDRKISLENIHDILNETRKALETNLGLKVIASHNLDGQREAKLKVLSKYAEIKIEPNYTLRGSLFNSVEKELTEKASHTFGKDVSALCLSLADCYGGKICAALDRQHPRDLFDIFHLFKNGGITDDIKDSFIFYLISHNRPINELLDPKLKDIEELFRTQFEKMALKQVTLQELLEARENLVNAIKKSLVRKDRDFLISFVSNTPDWSLVRDPKIQNFPSVKWKILNQQKMSNSKKSDYLKKVRKCLEFI